MSKKDDEIARLQAEIDTLRARAAGGPVAAAPGKPREEILAGPHHWRWQGHGTLFLGSGTGPDGGNQCGIQKPGDVVSGEFALAEIENGGASAAYLVPCEGEAEIDAPLALGSPNASLPRVRAHTRPATIPDHGGGAVA